MLIGNNVSEVANIAIQRAKKSSFSSGTDATSFKTDATKNDSSSSTFAAVQQPSLKTSDSVAYDEPMTTPSREEIDAKLKASTADLRADFAELRSELKADLGSLRVEFADIRSEMKSDMAEVKSALQSARSDHQKDVHEMNANVSRWMLQTTLAIIGTIVVGFAGLSVAIFNATKTSSTTAAVPAPVFITVPGAPAAAPAAPSAAAAPASKTP